jgi:hypothetical protein
MNRVDYTPVPSLESLQKRVADLPEGYAIYLKADVEALLRALEDAEYALGNLIEERLLDDDEDPEAPCEAEELCGRSLCNECGCLIAKRDAARAALAKFKETGA